MPQRIFITGASGYLGLAIAARLARSGHQVHGLTRDPDAARALSVIGVTPVIGDLEVEGDWVGDLKNCDAVVHTAMNYNDVAASDQKAIEAFRAAARDGRVRRLLYTSGIWVHGDTHGQVVDETTPLRPLEISKWRAAHEDAVLDLGDDEVKVVIFRPGIVYGGWRGIVGGMFGDARAKHAVIWPGEGTQHWVLVHLHDVAEAYALALEHALGGERYLLTDESSLTARDVAEAVARVTGTAAKGQPQAEVLAEFGNYGEALLASQRATSGKARRELGWVPRHTSFAIEADALYAEWQAGQQTPVA